MQCFVISIAHGRRFNSHHEMEFSVPWLVFARRYLGNYYLENLDARLVWRRQNYPVFDCNYPHLAMGLQKEEVRTHKSGDLYYFFWGILWNVPKRTSPDDWYCYQQHIHLPSPMSEEQLKAYPCRTNEDKEDATCTNDQWSPSSYFTQHYQLLTSIERQHGIERNLNSNNFSDLIFPNLVRVLFIWVNTTFV